MKLCQRDLRKKLGSVNRRPVFQHFFWDRRFLIHRPACLIHAVAKLVRHVFVHLVFQKLLHQFRSRIFLLSFLIHCFRKKHAAFDIQKGRCHDHKFTHNVKIFPFHLMNIRQILIGDLHNRNIVNIYFVFIDQVQQKVQRSFKHRKLYWYRHECLFSLIFARYLQ